MLIRFCLIFFFWGGGVSVNLGERFFSSVNLHQCFSPSVNFGQGFYPVVILDRVFPSSVNLGQCFFFQC